MKTAALGLLNVNPDRQIRVGLSWSQAALCQWLNDFRDSSRVAKNRFDEAIL